MEAFFLMPKEIRDISDNLRLSSFVNWAEKVIEDSQGIVSFSDLWAHLSDVEIDRVNKKEVELIQNVLDETGFSMAPDFRLHHARATPKGKVVIFYSGNDSFEDVSSSFVEARIALRFGAMVAKIDGVVHEPEVDMLKRFLDSNSNLSEFEKKSLNAYLTWRLNSPVNNRNLKKQIESLSESGKQTIRQFMVRIALVSGDLSQSEIKELLKLYTNLGFERNLLIEDIHSFKAATNSPKHPFEQVQPASLTFSLDEKALSHHERETKDIQSILNAIFTDNEQDEEVFETSEKGALERDNDREYLSVTGLDTEHHQLLKKLITQASWNRTEIELFCEGLGLMTDGAIESINDWSLEQYDEPLLEAYDGSIYVISETVELIAE